MAQLRQQRIEPHGWDAPAFAPTLEAPFLSAPLEVTQFAPALARLDAVAGDMGSVAGLYAEIRAAAILLMTASSLAGRAHFLAHLYGANAEVTCE